MKLLFPNGEHGPQELKAGINKIGSAPGSDILIAAPGIAMHHCDIDLGADGAQVKVPDGANVVVVNGKQVSGASPIKSGDLILFAKVGARVVTDKSAPAPSAKGKDKEPEGEDGRTKIRMAVPRYMLRGVSGATFGKTYPLYGTMTIGRQSDCDISIPSEEISRKHAKLQVMPDGVAVEDLGSANGTFLNGKRIHTATVKHGEELRFDTLRFLVVSPMMEAASGAPKPSSAAPAPVAAAPVARKGVHPAVFFVGAVILVGAALAGAYAMGWFGK